MHTDDTLERSRNPGPLALDQPNIDNGDTRDELHKKNFKMLPHTSRIPAGVLLMILSSIITTHPPLPLKVFRP